MGNPRVIVTDGRETGVTFPDPEEKAFRAGVVFANAVYDDACQIADAFDLACTEAYMSKAFGTIYPQGWKPVAIDLVNGMVTQLKWVVAGAGIGAIFGLGLGMILPPAEPLTLAGGAALGACIAQWALVATGLVALGGMTIQLSKVSIDLISRGVTEALAGHKAPAAVAFSLAIATILGAAIPLVLVVAVTKGAGKMMQARTTQFMINKVTTRIASSEITSAAMARTVGLLPNEWKAIAETTKGIIKVFRGCNPSRADAIEREGGFANIHFKPGYLKDFKSAKIGRTGEYMIDRSEFEAYIRGHYDLIPLRPRGGLYRVRAKDMTHKPGTYMENTSPVKGGPWLDNHMVEVLDVEGQTKYVIRHPDGKTFVPDVDRLFYAEIGQTGRLGKSGVLKGHDWLLNDDAREVVTWNQKMSEALSRLTGKIIDWRGYQHGKSADFQVKHPVTGVVGPGWPARNATTGMYTIENESIVISINGRLFITDWNGLATFCKCLEILHFKYPWANSIVVSK